MDWKVKKDIPIGREILLIQSTALLPSKNRPRTKPRYLKKNSNHVFAAITKTRRTLFFFAPFTLSIMIAMRLLKRIDAIMTNT